MRSIAVHTLAWLIAITAGIAVMFTGVAVAVHFSADTRGVVAACGVPLSFVLGPLILIELRKWIVARYLVLRDPPIPPARIISM